MEHSWKGLLDFSFLLNSIKNAYKELVLTKAYSFEISLYHVCISFQEVPEL